jgi:hypothetical protein
VAQVIAAAKTDANPIPEIFNPWLGDNFASTEIFPSLHT